MQLIHNMPYPGLREADRDIIKERKIRNMRRNLYDGGLTVNGDKKLAVFGIAAACAIGLINHMQYRNLAKRMEDLEVTVEMELFPDLGSPQNLSQGAQEKEERDWLDEDLPWSCEAGYSVGRCPAFKSFK